VQQVNLRHGRVNAYSIAFRLVLCPANPQAEVIGIALNVQQSVGYREVGRVGVGICKEASGA
jgi:hypothetical protein